MKGQTRAFDRIETARLMLVRPREEDAPAIFQRYAGDAEVTRYLTWPTHQSVNDTRLFVQFSDAEWARGPVGPLLIRSRETGQLLGGTGLSFEPGGDPSTGYVLARDSWGRGYATEALKAMVDLARDCGSPRVYALCHPDHAASIRVLEKCGFTQDAVLPDHSRFPNLTPGVKAPVARYSRHLM